MPRRDLSPNPRPKHRVDGHGRQAIEDRKSVRRGGATADAGKQGAALIDGERRRVVVWHAAMVLA
jgi:hypothetical protein